VKSKLFFALLGCTLSAILVRRARSGGKRGAPVRASNGCGGVRSTGPGAHRAERPLPRASREERRLVGSLERAPRAGHRSHEYQRKALDRFLSGAAGVEDTLSIIGSRSSSPTALWGLGRGARVEVHDSTYFANELRHVADYFRGASRGAHDTVGSHEEGL